MTSTIYFKDAKAMFEYQCAYGKIALRKGKGNVAIVTEVLKDDAPDTVRRGQLLMVKVADKDGGFLVPAATPSLAGDLLAVDDLVVWVPMKELGSMQKALGDKRCRWAGLIRAKIAAEYDPKGTTPYQVLCRYD